MFKLKHVELEWLVNLEKYREFRRQGFDAVKATVEPRSSRGCIKPPGQRRVLGDHGLDLRSIAGVEVSTEVSQFALLDLDLGQAAGIGVCSVQRLVKALGFAAQPTSWAGAAHLAITNTIGTVSSAARSARRFSDLRDSACHRRQDCCWGQRPQPTGLNHAVPDPNFSDSPYTSIAKSIPSFPSLLRTSLSKIAPVFPAEYQPTNNSRRTPLFFKLRKNSSWASRFNSV